MIRRAILLGAGGHGRVVRALALELGFDLIGVCDPSMTKGQDWQGIDVMGADDQVLQHDPNTVVLLNGIGTGPRATTRLDVQNRWAHRGYRFPALVHPYSWVAADVIMDAGVQVMAGSVVQPGVTVGRATIINSRSSIDHDCQIGIGCHIAPGATLCGDVCVGDGAFIGAGAVVRQGITIGAGAVLAAGAVLVADLPAGQMAMGSSAAKSVEQGRS